MDAPGVASLKARLSHYLRAVKNGEEVVVMDRDTPIARIIPYEQSAPLVVREPRPGYGRLGKVPLPPPVHLEHDVVDLLLEDRRRDQ